MKIILSKIFLSVFIFFILINTAVAEEDDDKYVSIWGNTLDGCDNNHQNYERELFKKLYKKDYYSAYSRLNAFLNYCMGDDGNDYGIKPETYLWMQNDLAFAALKNNCPNQAQIILYKMQLNPAYKTMSETLKKSFAHNIDLCQQQIKVFAPKTITQTNPSNKNSLPIALLNGAELLSKNTMQKVCQCAYCDYHAKNLSNFNPGYDLLTTPMYPVDSARNMICNFKYTDFSNAILEHSDFTVGAEYDTTLMEVDFNNANFNHASLVNSNFRDVDFSNVDFSSANLRKVAFNGCLLSKANFSDAILDSVVSEDIEAHGSSSIFQHTNFSNAHFINTDLYGSFRYANFSHAHFTKSTLPIYQYGEGPDFYDPETDSPDVCFEGTNFSYTDLRGVITGFNSGGWQPYFRKSILCHTIMPDGTISNRDCHRS